MNEQLAAETFTWFVSVWICFVLGKLKHALERRMWLLQRSARGKEVEYSVMWMGVAELWDLIHHSFHIDSFSTIEKFTCDRSFSLSRNKKIIRNVRWKRPITWNVAGNKFRHHLQFSDLWGTSFLSSLSKRWNHTTFTCVGGSKWTLLCLESAYFSLMR